MIITQNEMALIEQEIDRMNERLMELGCDSSQIIATAMLKGNCCWRIARGAGQLYARLGAISELIKEQDSMTLAFQLNSASNDEEE